MRRAFAVLAMSGVIVQPLPVTAERHVAANAPSVTASQPQARADIWKSLPDLPRGTRCRLLLVDGSDIVGRLVSARADAIVLEKNEIRKGPFSPPPGLALRDPLTFQRSEVSSVVQVKGWPTWAKVLMWVGIGWVVAGAIAGSIVGNS